MILNQATVNAAIEYYLNNVICKQPVKVASTRAAKDECYEVTLKENTDANNERNRST